MAKAVVDAAEPRLLDAGRNRGIGRRKLSSRRTQYHGEKCEGFSMMKWLGVRMRCLTRVMSVMIRGLR